MRHLRKRLWHRKFSIIHRVDGVLKWLSELFTEYSQRILQFKYDIKKRWTVIKEIIGKAKHSNKSNFPWKLEIDNNIRTSKEKIANKFKKYFADSVAKSVLEPSMSFKRYLKRVSASTQSSKSASIKELKDAFFSLITNKSPGGDEISFNVIQHCFGEFCSLFKNLFDSLLQSGVFLDLIKIAIVSYVFKIGHFADISNYRPISFLPFSSSSQLADQIYESFENDNYTVGIFIDLSKTFVTIDHSPLLKKLANFALFRSYLINRKQYICINNDSKANEQKVIYGVPQGSILGPLLFLIYSSAFLSAFSLRNTIFIADDTTPFFELKGIRVLLMTVNRELQNINVQVISSKLYVNVKKRDFQFLIKLVGEKIYHLCYQSFLLIIK